MTKQAHYVGAGLPNEYVQAMEGVREVEAFAAVVYSSAFELEYPPDSIPVAGGLPADTEKGEENENENQREGMAGTGAVVQDEKSGSAEVQVEAEDRGGGVVDKAWGGFESVWGKVTGRGGGGSGEPRPLVG